LSESPIFQTIELTPYLGEQEIAKLLFNDMLLLYETDRSDIASRHFLGKFFATDVIGGVKFVVRFLDREYSCRVTAFWWKKDKVARAVIVVDAEKSNEDFQV